MGAGGCTEEAEHPNRLPRIILQPGGIVSASCPQICLFQPALCLPEAAQEHGEVVTTVTGELLSSAGDQKPPKDFRKGTKLGLLPRAAPALTQNFFRQKFGTQAQRAAGPGAELRQLSHKNPESCNRKADAGPNAAQRGSHPLK